MSARDNLLREVGPALAYTRARAGADAFIDVDFDAARRQWIERLTGEREDGTSLRAASSLEEGQAPSLPRIRQWRDAVVQLVENLRDDPSRYGVNLRDFDEV